MGSAWPDGATVVYTCGGLAKYNSPGVHGVLYMPVLTQLSVHLLANKPALCASPCAIHVAIWTYAGLLTTVLVLDITIMYCLPSCMQPVHVSI